MNNPSVWQIATGDDGRRYDDIFVQHDVMFLGPGYSGSFDPTVYAKALELGEVTKDEHDRIARFCIQVRPSDYVLARAGKRVTALGVVADDPYTHDDRFDDVHGWQVQHTRRVIWQQSVSEALSHLQHAEPLFAHMKQIKTFTRADSGVIDKIKHLLPLCTTRDLKELPPSPSPVLTEDQFAEGLFGRGLSFDAVSRVCTAIRKVTRLVEWYSSPNCGGGRPTEHEVVAHIILPVMLALGWSEQQMAIEWNRIDLAAFRSTPTTNENCRLVVEAKGMWHGLQGVSKQATDYVENLPLPNCRRVLVTNGLRNYLYERDGHVWNACNYFNLRRLRASHIWNPGNAIDAIVSLSPTNIAN